MKEALDSVATTVDEKVLWRGNHVNLRDLLETIHLTRPTVCPLPQRVVPEPIQPHLLWHYLGVWAWLLARVLLCQSVYMSLDYWLPPFPHLHAILPPVLSLTPPDCFRLMSPPPTPPAGSSLSHRLFLSLHETSIPSNWWSSTGSARVPGQWYGRDQVWSLGMTYMKSIWRRKRDHKQMEFIHSNPIHPLHKNQHTYGVFYMESLVRNLIEL